MLSRAGPRKPGHSALPECSLRRGGCRLSRGCSGRFDFRRDGGRRFGLRRGSVRNSWGNLRRCRRRRDRRGLVGGLGQEPLLGRRRPSPMELRAAAADTSGPQQRPRHAREHDRGDHGQAPGSIGEMTGGHRPCDQGQAQERDRREVEQHPHPGHRDRLVDHEPCRRQRDDDQDDGPDALEPSCTAEQQPPDHDSESSQGSTHDREHPDRQGEQFGVRGDSRHDEREQPLQSHDDHAGPQPERLCESSVRRVA